MTDIKQILNSTALSIAKNLDKKDGVEDGKIKGSIWNQFVEDKGGNKISENGFISLENARKSITTYLMRNSQELGQTVKNLADNWLSKEGIEPDAEQPPAEDTPPVDGADPVQETDPVKKAQETEPVKRPTDVPPLHETPPILNVQKKGKDYSNINLNNIIKAKQIQYKEVVNNRFNGKDIAKQYEKYLSNGGTFTANANKDNVAYVVDKLFYDNAIKDNVASVNVISSMLKPLITKAKELKIKTNLTEQSKSLDKSTLAEIKRVASAIIEKEDSIENDYLAFASIKQPATSMAGKNIFDKATGKCYVYDKEGYISRIMEKGHYTIIKDKKGNMIDIVGNSTFNRYDNLTFLHMNNIYFEFDTKTGKVNEYDEYKTINGEKCRITRTNNGQIKHVLDGNGNVIYYDENGNIEFYTCHKKINGVTFDEYRNADGDLICYKTSYDTKYYDANGKEITEEEYLELLP